MLTKIFNSLQVSNSKLDATRKHPQHFHVFVFEAKKAELTPIGMFTLLCDYYYLAICLQPRLRRYSVLLMTALCPRSDSDPIDYYPLYGH